MTIEGSSMVITGAGRGLGAALARRAAERGARLVLIARGEEVEHVARSLRERGAVAHAIRADIADKDEVYRVAHSAAALIGPIDVLVHNAATLGPARLRTLQDTACEELSRALDVHVVGPFRLSKALLPSMVLRGTGAIVHVSSDAAVQAYPEWGAYGASKAAMEHMARTFAVELEGTGVRSLVVDPGEMDTALHAAALPETDRATLADPLQIATRLLDWLASPARSRNGARAELSHTMDVTEVAQ